MSASQLVDLWERGAGQHPVDRALTMVRAYAPEASREELAALSIGRRDALLLTFRELVFGSMMNAFADCPACGQHLEFDLPVGDLRLDRPEPPENLHLPDSYDLAAAAQAPDLASARLILAQRCGDVSEAELAALDPQADLHLQLCCAACHHGWSELFDIAVYFWTEIAAAAKRVVREVHRLALAYGWSEYDLLNMSGARRQLYLEMLG